MATSEHCCKSTPSGANSFFFSLYTDATTTFNRLFSRSSETDEPFAQQEARVSQRQCTYHEAPCPLPTATAADSPGRTALACDRLVLIVGVGDHLAFEVRKGRLHK